MQTICTFNICITDPDQILPAEKFSPHLRHEPVKLRLKAEGPEAEKPISIPTLLVNTVKRHGHGTALGEYKPLVNSPIFNSIQFKNFYSCNLHEFRKNLTILTFLIDVHYKNWIMALSEVLFSTNISTTLYLAFPCKNLTKKIFNIINSLTHKSEN